MYQEVPHSFRRKKGMNGGILVKLDLEKAYDRLEWTCIEDTLTRLGLPSNLVKDIMLCISSASFQILWNGVATEEFRLSRGLRQGDPLSHISLYFVWNDWDT